ncbi:MAG: hypothetical protein P8Y45_20140 [Exilibacterium sp.]
MTKHVILLSIFLSSCVFHRQAEPLPSAEFRKNTEGYIETIINPPVGREDSASIGDLIVSYTRISNSTEIAVARAPIKLKTLAREGWRKTHKYNNRDVYTSPDYYRGDIGAVLDKDEKVILYVQTGGAKSGRRWKSYGEKFFGRVSSVVDAWRLRYSGRENDSYKFEIVSTREDKAIEATQSFTVSETTFLDGFAVRGVLVQGLEAGRHGIISYRVAGNANK